ADAKGCYPPCAPPVPAHHQGQAQQWCGTRNGKENHAPCAVHENALRAWWDAHSHPPVLDLVLNTAHKQDDGFGTAHHGKPAARHGSPRGRESLARSHKNTAYRLVSVKTWANPSNHASAAPKPLTPPPPIAP